MVGESSTDAEIYAMSETSKDVIYLRNMLQDMGQTQNDPTVMHADNESAIAVSNFGKRKRTRHLDQRHLAILDRVENELITLNQVAGDKNMADALTKPIVGRRFNEFTSWILGESDSGNEDDPTSVQRGVLE